MRLLKKMLVAILLLFAVAAGCVFYGFKIEPYRITVHPFTLNERLPETEEIKIAQFSDLHIKEDFTYKNLRKVVGKINAQNPDIIVFTGDLYDNYAKYHDDEHIITELQNLNAKYGKIAIWGNRDYGGGAVRQYETIMDSSGFTLLKNGNWYITVDSGRKILFTGLDDSLLGQPVMPDSTKIYDADYEVLLSHEPDTAQDYQDYNYHLVLSGHSHGGQINIPLLPFINKAAASSTLLSSKYSGGMYNLSESSTKKIYVNTGIGTTHISARFGVVPEIALFTIYL